MMEPPELLLRLMYSICISSRKEDLTFPLNYLRFYIKISFHTKISFFFNISIVFNFTYSSLNLSSFFIQYSQIIITCPRPKLVARNNRLQVLHSLTPPPAHPPLSPPGLSLPPSYSASAIFGRPCKHSSWATGPDTGRTLGGGIAVVVPTPGS
jgi:hypothetical protein